MAELLAAARAPQAILEGRLEEALTPLRTALSFSLLHPPPILSVRVPVAHVQSGEVT